MSEEQVRNGGGILNPHLAEPQNTNQGFAVTSWSPCPSLKSKRWDLVPYLQPAGFHKLIPPAYPFKEEQRMEGSRAPKGQGTAPKFLDLQWASTRKGGEGGTQGLGLEFRKHKKAPGNGGGRGMRGPPQRPRPRRETRIW